MGKFFATLDQELDLYVSQSAWLNAVPDKAEDADPDTKAPDISRREVLQKKGVDDLDMPDCEAYYLVSYLFEIGPTVMNGMGEAPITQSDIADFQTNTGIDLNAWDARSLRRLSMVYLSASYKAKKPDAPAPWQEASYVLSIPNSKAESSRNRVRALANL